MLCPGRYHGDLIGRDDWKRCKYIMTWSIPGRKGILWLGYPIADFFGWLVGICIARRFDCLSRVKKVFTRLSTLATIVTVGSTSLQMGTEVFNELVLFLPATPLTTGNTSHLPWLDLEACICRGTLLCHARLHRVVHMPERPA